MQRRMLFVWSLMGSPAWATGRPVRVGVEDHEDYLPYSEFKQRHYRGLVRELLDAFAAAQGLALDYRVLPVRRRNLLLAKGELDLLVPDHPRWAPEAKQGLNMAYAPMVEFTDGAFVMPTHRGRGVTRIRRLGIPNGFTPFPYRQWIDRGDIQVEESGKHYGLFEKLRSGHIDAAYLNHRMGLHYFAQREPDPARRPVFDPELPHVDDFWHLSSATRPELVEAFRVFMARNPELLPQAKRHWGWDDAATSRPAAKPA